MNIVLTERDFRILYHIFSEKVSKMGVLSRYFFKDSIKPCSKRLNKLQSSGLVKISPISLKKSVIKVVNLTEKGFKTLSKEYLLNASNTKRKSECIEHDLIISDIKRRFLTSEKIHNYFLENELHSSLFANSFEELSYAKELNPDSLFEVSHGLNKYLFFVEFEKSHQSIQKYISKITQYIDTGKELDVLYIFKSPSAEISFRNALKSINYDFQKVRFFSQRLDIFMSQNERVEFKDLTNIDNNLEFFLPQTGRRIGGESLANA